jgi:hypothetical protein
MNPGELRILSRQDILNGLQAVRSAVHVTTAALENDRHFAVYRQGFEEALRCVALSFGISFSSADTVSNSSGLQIWYRVDIQHSLAAVYATLRAVAVICGDDLGPATYLSGFEAGLQCVAQSFGVKLALTAAGSDNRGVN